MTLAHGERKRMSAVGGQEVEVQDTEEAKRTGKPNGASRKTPSLFEVTVKRASVISSFMRF